MVFAPANYKRRTLHGGNRENERGGAMSETPRSNSSILPQVHITLETLTSRRTCLFSQTLIYLDEASSIKTASERNILAPDPANQCHYHYTLSETRRGSSAVSRGGQTALGKWGQAQVQGQGSKVKLPGKWAQLCRDVWVYGLDVRSVWTGDQSRPLPLCLYWWVAVSLWSCGQTQGSAKLLEK